MNRPRTAIRNGICIAAVAAVGLTAGVMYAAQTDSGVSAAPVDALAGPGPVFRPPLILNSHPPEGRISNLYGGPGIDGNAQVATDGAGHWVAVWHSSDTLGERIGKDWDVLVARSVDNGKTWSAKATLNRNAATDEGSDLSPVVTTDEAGTWIAAWSSNDSFGGAFRRDADIFFARSTNNGRSWSQPMPLNVTAADDWGDDADVRMATNGSGVWVTVWSSNDSLSNRVGGDSDIFVSRSVDDGATWTSPRPLNTNAMVDRGFDTSPDIVTDGAGRWLVVWSSGESGGGVGADRDLLIARSDDDGASWTDPAPLNSNATSDENSDWSPRLASDGRGHWVAVWTSADSLGEAIGVDRDVLISRSIDNGMSWSQARALNQNAAVDTREDSSPVIVTDGLGNWLVAWHAWGGFTYDDGSDADIVAAYSHDNGATWSVPVHANRRAQKDNVDDILPGLATDGAGHWVAVWQSFHPPSVAAGASEWRVVAVRGTIEGGGALAPAAPQGRAAQRDRQDNRKAAGAEGATKTE